MILELAVDLVQSHIAHGIQPGQQNQGSDLCWSECQCLKQAFSQNLTVALFFAEHEIFRNILNKGKSSKIKYLWKMILLHS